MAPEEQAKHDFGPHSPYVCTTTANSQEFWLDAGSPFRRLAGVKEWERLSGSQRSPG